MRFLRLSVPVFALSLFACAHGVDEGLGDTRTVEIGTAAGGPTPLLAHDPPPRSQAIRAPGQDALYVLVRKDREIRLLHPETLDWLGTIELESKAEPESMTESPDGTRLAVSFPGDGGALLVMEASTGRTLAARRLPSANANAAFSPDGAQIWTAQDDGSVLVLDAANLSLLDRVQVGKRPAYVAFANDGRTVWVSNEGSGDMTALDARTHAVLRTVQVEPGPRAIWPGEDGLLYVDCSSALAIVDPSGEKPTRRISMRASPGRAVADASGVVWVASGDGHVVTFDRLGNELARFASAPGATDLVFAPGDARGFVTNDRSGSVTIFDPSTRAVTGTVNVGEHPGSALFRPIRRLSARDQTALPIAE